MRKLCAVCVFVSSGEWARIGNPVYGVIDFPVPATGSGWLLIPRDSDVTPDGVSCLLTHDKVWGAFPLHTDQIMLCFCPRTCYHSSLITLSTYLFFRPLWMPSLTPSSIMCDVITDHWTRLLIKTIQVNWSLSFVTNPLYHYFIFHNSKGCSKYKLYMIIMFLSLFQNN